MNVVFNFHDVKNIDWFKKTLIFLKRKYSIVDISELEDYYYNGKMLKNVCHITIDDGDRTFYNNIYPILKEYRIPGTLFISPKICSNSENFWFQEIRGFDAYNLKKLISYHINIKIEKLIPFSPGRILLNFKINDIWDIILKYKELFEPPEMEPQNITNDQVIEIDKYGLVTIGAHTLNHPILANEDIAICRKEIVQSFIDLQYIVNHPIKYFAYPNGRPGIDFNQREIEILKKNNCRLSFSTEANTFIVKNNPLAIPRIGLSHGNECFINAKSILGQYWEIKKYKKTRDERKLRSIINIL